MNASYYTLLKTPSPDGRHSQWSSPKQEHVEASAVNVTPVLCFANYETDREIRSRELTLTQTNRFQSKEPQN